MLTIQYRMHPGLYLKHYLKCIVASKNIFSYLEIRVFPSERFYHGLLVDADIILEEVRHARSPRAASSAIVSGERVRHGVSSPILVDMKIRPVSFYDINRGAEVKVGKSLRNDAEVDFVVKFLERFGGKLHEHSLTIAVITPYKAQVHRFKEAFRKSATIASIGSKSSQEVSKSGGGDNAKESAAVEETETIEINTVDGFQGREKDIVIFSCVRAGGGSGFHRSYNGGADRSSRNSNYNGSHVAGVENGSAAYCSIGFVSDERRMNVALTRARKALVIVGSVRKLKQDALWDSLLQSLHARGLIMMEGESGAFDS